jgi:hypothetical protein
MAAESRNTIWIFVVIIFGLMITAWVTFFVITSKHKVEEVPLQSRPAQTP